jgi:hypothetical protein
MTGLEFETSEQRLAAGGWQATSGWQAAGGQVGPE